ncbi:geranylgeranyl pyrophosphate synthase [Rhizobium anhuiense]
MGVVIPLEESKNKLASIKPLVDLTRADMERVNQLILSKAGSDVQMIPEVANHLISSGGKRLRPMLTLASASLFDYRVRKPRQARHIGRVHAHGDAAA